MALRSRVTVMGTRSGKRTTPVAMPGEISGRVMVAKVRHGPARLQAESKFLTTGVYDRFVATIGK